MKIVLFDIDSTLLRDAGASSAAFDFAFAEMFGRTPAPLDRHGRTDPFIARHIALSTIGRELGREEDVALHARYVELLPECLDKSAGFRVLPGARELCEVLAADGSFVLGLQTGNLEPCAWAKVKRAGLDAYFSFGAFASDAEDRSHIVRTAIRRGRESAGVPVAASDVFVLGDSLNDIAAGNDNGAFAIGVATGKSSPDELIAAGAGLVVSDLRETSAMYKVLKPSRVREVL